MALPNAVSLPIRAFTNLSLQTRTRLLMRIPSNLQTPPTSCLRHKSSWRRRRTKEPVISSSNLPFPEDESAVFDPADLIEEPRPPPQVKSLAEKKAEMMRLVKERQEKLRVIGSLDQREVPEPQSRQSLLATAQQSMEPHFTVGMKQVWLPDFELVLIRTPYLHPRFAKFLVPLWFTKLDIRDFLWHGYGVRALNVRSWVYMRPVQMGSDKRLGKAKAAYRRRRSLKYMTIEMDEPFRGPVLPDNFDGLDKTIFDKMTKLEEQQSKANEQGDQAGWVKGTEDMVEVRKKRKEVRDLARQMLKGEVKWTPDVNTHPRPSMLGNRRA